MANTLQDGGKDHRWNRKDVELLLAILRTLFSAASLALGIWWLFSLNGLPGP